MCIRASSVGNVSYKPFHAVLGRSSLWWTLCMHETHTLRKVQQQYSKRRFFVHGFVNSCVHGFVNSCVNTLLCTRICK